MNSSNPNDRVYNLSLLFSFFANVFQLISVSLLFRYSDFITSVGGDEWHLGWVVGVSSVGAIVLRLYLGSAIDRMGPEWIWYFCLIGQITGLIWHLFLESPASTGLFLARTVYATSLAGTFGSWLSLVSLQAPQTRVAEVIGVVGSSGFVGMAIGPIIGDLIFVSGASFEDCVRSMFFWAIGSLGMAFLFAVISCRTAKLRVHKRQSRIENPIRVIFNARPGFVLLLGALMGLTIGFPGTYLRPLAASLNLEQIKVFFVVYNLTAFISRLCFRRAPQTLGLKTTICIGFLFMMLSMILYLLVADEGGLAWPALAGGLSHSFLFPSVIALCTQKFAVENRGVATNLILAMYDVGVLIGMPAVGAILRTADYLEIPTYSTVVIILASSIGLVLTAYIFAAPEDAVQSVDEG